MHIVIDLLILALNIYFWIVIVTVLASWLVAFDVLNTKNKLVFKACDLMNKVTNPLVLRLRKVIPPVGGIDLTPMVIIFGIYLLQNILLNIRQDMAMTGF